MTCDQYTIYNILSAGPLQHIYSIYTPFASKCDAKLQHCDIHAVHFVLREGQCFFHVFISTPILNISTCRCHRQHMFFPSSDLVPTSIDQSWTLHFRVLSCWDISFAVRVVCFNPNFTGISCTMMFGQQYWRALTHWRLLSKILVQCGWRLPTNSIYEASGYCVWGLLDFSRTIAPNYLKVTPLDFRFRSEPLRHLGKIVIKTYVFREQG